MTGIKQPSIARFERGSFLPSWKNIEKIDKALGCEIKLVRKSKLKRLIEI
jgi:hypothetical protein